MNKKTLFSIILSTLLLTILIAPLVALGANGLTCGSDANGNPKLKTIMDNIKMAASAIGAGIAVIGFIIAGILYLTSAGSPEKTGIAKKAIIAAVIGTFLIALAQGADIMTSIFCVIIGAT